LTPKHIDVPELLKHTLFEGIVPHILKGNEIRIGEKSYPCPVPDFAISKIELIAKRAYANTTEGLEIIIVTAGGAILNNSIVLKRGEVICLLPDTEYILESSGNCTLFKAFI
jgi:mannose-6-phosphate isomerase